MRNLLSQGYYQRRLGGAAWQNWRVPKPDLERLTGIASDKTQLRKAIMTVRLTIGGVGLLAPRTMAALFGVEAPRGSSTAPILRMFAVREALMAYQLYQAPDEELEEVLRQGIVVDAIDSAAVLGAFARGDIGLRTLLMTCSAAGAVGAAGYIARPRYGGASDQ